MTEPSVGRSVVVVVITIAASGPAQSGALLGDRAAGCSARVYYGRPGRRRNVRCCVLVGEVIIGYDEIMTEKKIRIYQKIYKKK